MKQALPFAIGALVVVALALGWVSNCAGPEPSLIAANFATPASPGEPYILSAVIRNNGAGQGEVAVRLRLVDSGSGRSFEKATTAQLAGRETVTVTEELYGVPPGSYQIEVELEYPPR